MSTQTPPELEPEEQAQTQTENKPARVDGGDSQRKIVTICNHCQRPINEAKETHHVRCGGDRVHGKCVEQWL